MTSSSFWIHAASILLFSIVPVNMKAGEAPATYRGLTSELWESGQRLFYSDRFWRGGDCASTVDLGDGRVLWLFADSYIAVALPYTRDSCCVTMIRNCLGIQTGHDPSTADFEVFWREARGSPKAYFPGDDSSWYWPGNAVRVDSSLVVFLMHLCPSDSGLGFRECSDYPHAAFLVDHIDSDPTEWTLTHLDLPEARFGIMLGAATLVSRPYVYMFNVDVQDAADASMFLSRWRSDSLLAGSTGAIEWWAGDESTWISDSELTSKPVAVFTEGATELSVIYDETVRCYLAIQTVGFGAADVMMRTAPALTGPWSDLQLVYQPFEQTVPDIMIYAAKAHPEIAGADLIITYNTNAPIQTIIADTAIYYPRFVKLNWMR